MDEQPDLEYRLFIETPYDDSWSPIDGLFEVHFELRHLIIDSEGTNVCFVAP